jgi:hypothetical protein
VLKKTGNRLEYINKETGEAIAKFRKAWEANDNEHLDLIMRQWNDHDTDLTVNELNIQDEQSILEDINNNEND